MCFNARFLNTGFALGFEPFLNFKFVICVKNNEDRLGFIWIRDNFFSINFISDCFTHGLTSWFLAQKDDSTKL